MITTYNLKKTIDMVFTLKRTIYSNKNKIFILLVFLLLSSINLFADRRDELLGAWRGTYTNNNGINGMEIAVFRVGQSYEAVVWFFPTENSPRSQREGSFRSNVRFNSSSNRFELTASANIEMPRGWSSLNISGTVRQDRFSGNDMSNTNRTVLLNRIQRSNFTIPGPHDHFPRSTYRNITTATCQREGLRIFDCVFCNAEARRETLPRTAHTPQSNWITLSNPTCTQTGERAQNCTHCNTEVRREPVPARGHTPQTNWTITRRPSCSESGEQIRNCTVCSVQVDRQQIPTLPHTPHHEWTITKAPLCNETGTRVRTCSVCESETHRETIPSLGGRHNFDSKELNTNIFWGPLLYEDTCNICNHVAERKDYSYIWLTPLLLLILVIALIISAKFYLKIKNSFICPYCFKKLDKRKIPYICKNAGCEIKHYPNVIGKKPSTCKKTDCSGMLVPHCPDQNCGREIVQEALDFPSIPITIMGTSQSGKTVFTTVMLRELGRITSPSLHRGSSDEDTFVEFSNIVKTLYDDKELPPNTDQAKRAPQIWPIKNITKGLSYVFKIYDASGENFERNLAPSKIDCEFLRASKALVYILDAERIMKATEDGLAVKIVDNLASYLKKANPKFKGIIKIPIAVVLAKFDKIANHPDFSKRATVYSQSNTIVEGKLNLAEIDLVDAEIKRWLEDNNRVEILKSFEASFSDYRFFGVSSLGASPNDDATLPHPPNPHRVLDPVLWLFNKEKFID